MEASSSAPAESATPFFSIVIPCYNRADVIGPTIVSCLEQIDRDHEIIVVDDGSTDDLAAALATFSDARLRYVRQANGGGGAARNRGIAESRGAYIAFLDSDDRFTPDKLEACRSFIARTAAKLVYSAVLVDRGPGRTWIKPGRAIQTDEDVGEYLFVEDGLIQTSAIVVEAALARQVMFDPSLPKGQDLDFCLRLAATGERFSFIPRPLAIWTDRGHAGRTSHKPGAAAPLRWLAKSEALLTRRALVGYRATVLSYYLAKERPKQAVLDILQARRELGFGWGRTLRLLLRALLPQAAYRRLVDTFIDLKAGRRANEAASPAPV
jgi:glycosyltransferase involved in cell wall biosynthesis